MSYVRLTTRGQIIFIKTSAISFWFHSVLVANIIRKKRSSENSEIPLHKTLLTDITRNVSRRKQTHREGHTHKHDSDNLIAVSSEVRSDQMILATGWLIDCANTPARTPRCFSSSLSLVFSPSLSPSYVNQMWRRDDGVATSIRSRVSSAYPSLLSFLTPASRIIISQILTLPSRGIHARVNICTIWPRGCNWPRQHVQPPLPNMAACQFSPPPLPLPVAAAAEDTTPRVIALWFVARLVARITIHTRLVSLSLSIPMRRCYEFRIDQSREICYDSTPPKSRAIRFNRPSESAPNAADSRSGDLASPFLPSSLLSSLSLFLCLRSFFRSSFLFFFSLSLFN